MTQVYEMIGTIDAKKVVGLRDVMRDIPSGETLILVINSEGGEVPPDIYSGLSRMNDMKSVLVTIGLSQVVSAAFDLFLLGKRRFLLNPECVQRHDACPPVDATPKLKEQYVWKNQFWNEMGAAQLQMDVVAFKKATPTYRSLDDAEILELKIAHRLVRNTDIQNWKQIPDLAEFL